MLVLGLQRPLKQLATVETFFDPTPGTETAYSRDKPGDPLQEPPFYYQWMHFDCRIGIDVRHPEKPIAGANKRLKRFPRIYRVVYYPTPASVRDDIPGAEIFEVDDYKGVPLVTFSSARINVTEIAEHCRTVLGLRKDSTSTLDAALEEVIAERNARE